VHQQALKTKVNDFAFKLANVNGTGSASANGLLMQAIFRMGIPVSGKNLFPSNIQGLPTWYEIRVKKDGHTARTSEYDLMVAMNAETYARDIREVRSGGYVLYDSTWPLPKELLRSDVTFLGAPFAKLCAEAFKDSRERTLMKNIAYVGALASLLDHRHGRGGQDARGEVLEEARSARVEQQGHPPRLRVRAGSLPARCRMRLETMDATKDSILIDGNTATALGACTRARPSPPGTRSRRHQRARRVQGLLRALPHRQGHGEEELRLLQAEDELGAVGMVIGASWNGARAFTSTAGPGISLMNELIGLAYYAEIPAVIVDVQRVGPSTGMPTRTQQGDILLCAYASHGDTKHICLYPANPEECFHFAVQSFDLAERFQTPVFMLTDLDIGMNDWVVPKLRWDDSYKPDRGRVLSREEIEKMSVYYRYSPEDELGVAARTVPGTHPKGAFFTRGSGHNKLGKYTEIAGSVRRGDGPPLPQAPRVARLRAARADREAATARPSVMLTVGGCDLAAREAMIELAPRASWATSCACAASPSATRSRLSSPSTTPCSWWSRTATPSSARCSCSRRRRPRTSSRSVLATAASRCRPRKSRAACAPRSPRRRRADELHQEAGRSASVAPAQQARPHRARLRRLDVHALRGLRPRLGDGRHRARFYELDIPPHTVAKLSGIGCSSKTPTYFLSGAHGFNSAHGRMPAIVTGANAANKTLHYIGVSGDGDSLSIGLGQLCHAIRRNVNMLYVLENNGVYGLTKGQFSASTDVGSSRKKRRAQHPAPDRSGAPRHQPRRVLRREELLRRQGAARAAPQGGPQSQGLRAGRRHLALRDLQRSRGLDQELHAHAQAPAPVVHADFVPFASRRSAPSYPEGTSQAGEDARRQRGALLQGGEGLRPGPIATSVLAYLAGAPALGRGADGPALHRRRSGGDARGSEDGGHAALGAAVRDALPGQRRAREADVRLPLSAPAAPLPPRECGYF
jgi:2-oxoglutarate ferredoxin oxidoreductase subunit alpha